MLGGELVVVGGKGNAGSRLKSAEVYDVSAGQWRAFPDMSVERGGCAAVCIDGNVYVMGGFDGRSYLKSADTTRGTVYKLRLMLWFLDTNRSSTVGIMLTPPQAGAGTNVGFALLILEVADGTAGWPACRAVGQLRGWVE